MNKRIYYLLAVCLLCLNQLAAQVMVESGLPVTIESGLPVSIQGPLAVASTLTNEGTLSFNDSISVASYTGAGTLLANGADQYLDFNGNTISTIEMSPGNKFLLSGFTVSNLTLDNAIVSVDTARLEVTGDLSGFDSNAYITGRLIRSGADTLYYPVSDGTSYTPVLLTGITGSSPAIAVEAIAADPLAIAGNSLLDVSNERYWNISEASGTLSSMRVQLPVVNESVVNNTIDLAVAYGASTDARFRGLGQLTTSGTLTEGTVMANELSLAGIYAVGKLFDEELREADSLALLQIYESTGGTNWAAASGWLDNNLDLWGQVTLVDKRVAELDLSNNNLTSDFPSISEGLEAMVALNLQDNELTAIGDLSNLTALQSLDVSGNMLQFGTLEGVLSTHPDATYAPQQEVLERIRTLEQIGNTYTIDRTVTGSANLYSWTKNSTAISQTSSSFDVSIDDFTVDGSYVAQVTNTNVPGLTLTTAPVVLRVSSTERDSASLLVLYHALVTESSTITDWPNLPMSEWDEVDITSSRVTSLDMSGLNLSGEVPEELLDIQSLVSADFSGNDIFGLPTLTGSLPNVTSLNFAENLLTFEDLESNVAFAPLDYSNQKRFGVRVADTIRAGSAYEISKPVGGSQNEYQWYLTNDLVTDSVLAGANGADLIIDSLTYENMGRYELRVASPLVPDLILKSRFHRVMAFADLDFTALGLGDQPFIAAEAYALRVTLPGNPYDTIQTVRGAGTGFNFDKLILGDYLVAVSPDNLNEFLPTYYPSTDLWTDAEEFILRVDASDTLYMAEIPDETNNPDGAAVSGTVESDFEEESVDPEEGRINARRKVKRAGCSVRRFVPKGRTNQEEEGDYVLYAYVQSDDEGRFEFTGLEDGKYRFNIEYPGIPMDPDSYVEFTVGEGGIEEEVLVLQATVTEDGIVVEKIERLGFYRKYFKDLSVYPNPAQDYLKIAYSKLMSASVTVLLMDLEGQVLKEQKIKKGYNQELNMDVSDISGGIYLLNFVDTNLGAEKITTFKVYVKHHK